MKRFAIFMTMLLVGASGSACDSIRWHNPDDLEIDPNSVLTFHPDRAAIPADGLSRVALTARLLPEQIDAAHRTITFTSTAGTLIGEDGGSLKVAVDEDRTATVYLQSSTRIEIAVVNAQVAGVVQSAQVSFEKVEPADRLTLMIPQPTIPADGVSSLIVKAQLGPSATSRSVSFKTSAGMFVGGMGPSITRTADEDDVVQATLISTTTPGDVLLEATLGEHIQRTTLTFEPAPPHVIQVDGGAFSVVADTTYGSTSQTTVTAHLRRTNGGVASLGTEVRFLATDEEGHVLPGFREKTDGFRSVTLANAQGEAMAKFSAGGSKYQGTLLFRVELVDDPTVFGTAQIKVLPLPSGSNGS